MKELDFDRLAALATVVSEGSFDAAARKLHVTPSAVSQRIRALETTAGRVLVTRSRPVRPTASGVVLVRAARQIMAVAEEAASQLGDEPGATVSVPLAVNADSLATWFVPALAGLDGAVFDIQRADQDLTADLLRQGLVWAAVTASPAAIPGCSLSLLGTMRYRALASEHFVEHYMPSGPLPSALAQAPVVVYDRSDRLQDRYLKRRARRPLDPPRHYVPSSEAFIRAVQLGLGWGMVPDLQAASVKRPGLVAFDPEGTLDVALYWAQLRRSSPTLERLAAAVRVAATTSLLARSPARQG